MKLRDYQVDYVEGIRKRLDNYKRPFVVVAPTGAGKSVLIAEMAKMTDLPTIVLCPNKELCEQDYGKLVAVGLKPTYYSASISKELSNLMVGTIGSMYKTPELFEHVGLVIADECDTIPCGDVDSMAMKLLREIKPKVVGLTASPYRMTSKTLRTSTGDMEQTTQVKALNRVNCKGGFFWSEVWQPYTHVDLTNKGYLTPLSYFAQPTDTTMLRVNSTGADYTEDSVAKWADTSISSVIRCIEGARSHWKSRAILVSVPRIEDAQTLRDELVGHGIRAGVCHSKLGKKDRANIVADFKAGRVEVMAQVMTLSVGFDYPELDCLIFARPTLSLRIWQQFCGRGVRIADGKTDCKVIDLTGTFDMFGGVEVIRAGKETGGFRTVIRGQRGVISDKPLSKVNITQMIKARKRKQWKNQQKQPTQAN